MSTCFGLNSKKCFGEIDRATKALKKLKNLKQKLSVQDYVTKFQSLAAYVNYDDLALRDMFYEGLKDEIKMAMLSQMFDVKDTTTTGQMVVDRALLINQHLEQFSGCTMFENKIPHLPITVQLPHPIPPVKNCPPAMLFT
ncbi:Transposon Tf2-12 polyprotein [Ceratobasidium sp. AG-Ba]|nr:Transposon Tf2-12 polyprotein [Ceratobasidium sp. AG-Ba]